MYLMGPRAYNALLQSRGGEAQRRQAGLRRGFSFFDSLPRWYNPSARAFLIFLRESFLSLSLCLASSLLYMRLGFLSGARYLAPSRHLPMPVRARAIPPPRARAYIEWVCGREIYYNTAKIAQLPSYTRY